MAGFSEFLINNMKSSLEPEDLRIFSRKPKCGAMIRNEFGSVNSTLIPPFKSHARNQHANLMLKKNLNQSEYEVFDERYKDLTSESDSDQAETKDQYKSTPFARQQGNDSGDLNAGYSRYRVISHILKESVQKKTSKVNAETGENTKNAKNLTYDKSWKNLAHKYDAPLKSPERKQLSNFVNKTLEKTKTMVIHHEKEHHVKLGAEMPQASALTMCVSSIGDESETVSGSKKVTTNPIYVSDSKLKDKEMCMQRKFSLINIDDLKPINASFSQIENANEMVIKIII